MNFKTTENNTARLEIHEDAKSAIKSKKQWEKIGFNVKMYFVNDSCDTLTGLEITC